ncbi:unnamed protein product [Lactuca saligna]|uniref:Uncharacterized protein n=1 Tax=Lactuca saligna TaxID=75948 RepID=A0AA35YB33_LACSI|nr:unnamed protein product [Lactuca saligna]
MQCQISILKFSIEIFFKNLDLDMKTGLGKLKETLISVASPQQNTVNQGELPHILYQECPKGHSSGGINFWDASSPLLIPIVSFNQQSEDDQTLSGVPLTALCYDMETCLLISGDQTGTVRIYKFKPEPYAIESSFLSLQASSKKGSNIVQSVKLVKVNGAVVSITTSHDSKHIAVGSDQGYVSVIDIGGATVLYERRIASEISTAVISLQFGMCSLHGFEKSVLMAATKDSSAWALECETGNILNNGSVHPKKPSKALLIQMLDEQGTAGRGSNASKGIIGNSFDDGVVKESLLLCSEKAVYVYSLSHAVQYLSFWAMFLQLTGVRYEFGAAIFWSQIVRFRGEFALHFLIPTGKLFRPSIRCSSDETVASRMATNEIQFFDFSKGMVHKIRIPGIAAVELSKQPGSHDAVFVPESKEKKDLYMMFNGRIQGKNLQLFMDIRNSQYHGLNNASESFEHAIQRVIDDNLELGCASTEKLLLWVFYECPKALKMSDARVILLSALHNVIQILSNCYNPPESLVDRFNWLMKGFNDWDNSSYLQGFGTMRRQSSILTT